jgi:maltose alpha-D-glucosyltransferase / alpha-amylase
MELRIKDTAQPTLNVEWNDLFQQEKSIHQLENQVLTTYLKRMRWFGGKARAVNAVKVYQNIQIETSEGFAHYLLLKVRYLDGPTEIYALPVVFISDRQAELGEIPSEAIICRLENEIQSGYLIDGIYSENFRNALFMLIAKNKTLQGNHYPVKATTGKFLIEKGIPENLSSKVLKADQSNSAIVFNNTFFVKLFRKVEYMVNPDFEIINFLTEQHQFEHIPSYGGSVELQHPEKPKMLLLMLQQLVPNKGDAWQYFITELKEFFAKVVSEEYHLRPLPIRPHTLSLSWENTPASLQDLIGKDVAERASLLGKRTAEMHMALANAPNNSDFSPRALDENFQNNLLQNLEKLVKNKFELLEKNIEKVPISLKQDAQEMIQEYDRVIAFLRRVLGKPLEGNRIRIHGDYHLGQVLVTDNDFCILDFEGEPDKLHEERRDLYPSLKDVAGMMRSFRYAAYAVLFQQFENDADLRDKLMPVADVWYHYTSRYFLGAYIETARGSGIIPGDDKINDLLQIYSFKKAIYELGYEINNRPDWAVIPLQSLVKFVKHYLD